MDFLKCLLLALVFTKLCSIAVKLVCKSTGLSYHYYNLGVRPLKSPFTPWEATSSLAMARLPWDTPAQGGRLSATDPKLDEKIANNVACLDKD